MKPHHKVEVLMCGYSPGTLRKFDNLCQAYNNDIEREETISNQDSSQQQTQSNHLSMTKNQEPTQQRNQEPTQHGNQEPTQQSNQEPTRQSNQEPTRQSDQEPIKELKGNKETKIYPLRLRLINVEHGNELKFMRMKLQC